MATPSLSDLTYYANRSQGGVSQQDVDSARGQAALAAAQQYDPQASWRPVYGSDGQQLGYTLDFDASKLPSASGTGSLGGTSGHGSGADYQIPFSTVQQNMQLVNPSATSNSPVYGNITANENIQNPEDWISKWGGPALVAAFAATFGGIPFLGPGITDSIPGAGFDLAGATPLDTLPAYNPTYGDMLPFNPTPGDIGLSGAAPGLDMTGFQVPGGASGAFTNALGGTTPAAGLQGFQIPGGAAGNFGIAGSGISPSTANIIGDINSPSLFNVGGPGGTALAGLDDGTQAAAPIVDEGQPARVMDVLRNGGIPGPGNIMQSLSELPLGQFANALGKIPGVGGTGTGGGGGGSGGGGLLNFQAQPYGSLEAIIKKYYGGLLNG